MALAQDTKKQLRHLAYLAGFFLNLNTALTAYINSSVLEQFASEKLVGLFYVASSILMIGGSLLIHRFIHRLGSRRVLVGLSLAVLATLIAAILYFDHWLVMILVMAYLVLVYLLTINLDLYLEQVSTDSVTGQIRGIFLTLVNLAWLLSPLLATTLVARQGFVAVYLLATLALIPFFYLVTQLKRVEQKPYSHREIWSTLKQITRAENEKMLNLRRIITIDFVLNFFYATMVIYMPIYLHQFMNFGWPTIGKILTIMLIPFVILDFVLGRLADKLTGEKELLLSGLLIAGVSTLVVGLLNSPLPLVWAAALFATRVGAATIEMMKESYLFKQIDGGEINIIFISRNTYPLSYIIAPIIASAFLFVLPYQYLFIFLGLIVLSPIPLALALKDTR